MRSELVDLEVTVHHETTKMQDGEDRGAWLVESDVSSPKKIWVPKSQCEVGDRRPAPSKQATITLSESMAVSKGLI